MALERITEARIADMPTDQSSRYVFALDYIPFGAYIVDAGCGCGHGTYLLSLKGEGVLGLDYSPEALAFARKNYSRRDAIIKYQEWDGETDPIPQAFDRPWDVVVAFEFLEHIEDDKGFVERAWKASRDGALLIVSAPHPTWDKGRNPFHKRVYDPIALANLVREGGWTISSFWNQMMMFGEGFRRPQEPLGSVRCTVLVCRKEKPKA